MHQFSDLPGSSRRPPHTKAHLRERERLGAHPPPGWPKSTSKSIVRRRLTIMRRV